MMALSDDVITRAILELTGARGPEKSVCPSEVARSLSEDWRSSMAPIRRVSTELARIGRIDILRHGKPIDPAAVRGVIRLRMRS